MKIPATLLLCYASTFSAVQAATPPYILVPGTKLFTESITSTADGTVIISSMLPGSIFRAKPGEAIAKPWIPPGTNGLVNVLGVLADDKSKTLWACSFTFKPEAAASPPSALHAFDLNTGAPKGRWPLPTTGGLCNDIAIGPDGAAYASDTNNMQVLVLRPGAKSLEVWAGGGAFGDKGDLLDGITVLRNRIFVNALKTGRLFSVRIEADGSAGTVSEVKLDRPLQQPDGQRAVGAKSLLIVDAGEGGRLLRIDLSGDGLDQGRATTLKAGFTNGPTGVTVTGRTAYVIEGQFANADKPPPIPFKAIAVAVSR